MATIGPAGALAGLGLGLAAAACLPRAVFGCEVDEQCVDGSGARGWCETAGFCSYPDDGCDSGRRYDGYAGGGIADTCVPGTSGGSTSGTTGVTMPDLGDGEESGSSTTDATEACGNGVVEGDEECDDDNDIDGDGCNTDCRRSGQAVWTRTHSTPGGEDDKAFDVTVRDDGNIVVVGEVGTENVDTDIWIRQYEPDGSATWTWTLDVDGSEDIGWDVVPAQNGGVVAAGYVTSATTGEDLWVGEINTRGALVWDEIIDGGVAGRDNARGVALAADADLLLTGSVVVTDGDTPDLWLRRYDAMAQNERWTQVVDDGAVMRLSRAHALKVTADGDVIACGFVGSDTEPNTWWLGRYDGAGGELGTDSGPPGGGERTLCVDLALRPRGGYAAVGEVARDIAIEVRDSDDALAWTKIVDSPASDDDKANTVAVDSAGNVIVAGELGAGAGTTDAWIRKYDPDGEELWTDMYSGPAGQRDTIWGVAIAPDDEIVVVGYHTVPGEGNDIWVRKYTP